MASDAAHYNLRLREPSRATRRTRGPIRLSAAGPAMADGPLWQALAPGRDAHHGTFAPLFWCLVLPGPLGLVLYPLALRAARSWEHLVERDERDFGWFAARAFHVIDWIPQRLTAFVFAIVGDFEDALFCWR